MRVRAGDVLLDPPPVDAQCAQGRPDGLPRDVHRCDALLKTSLRQHIERSQAGWSIGVKVCWIIKTFGQVCGWIWDGMNCPDQTFLDLLEEYDAQAVILADWGFRCAQGVPANVKICRKGTWNDRMPVETTFSLLTFVCNAKRIFRRVEDYIEARLAYMAAMFNVLLQLFHQLHPGESMFKMSIAEFAL